VKGSAVPAQSRRQPDPVWSRVLFAVGAALAISFIIATDGTAATVEPYLFACAIGACLLVPPRPPGLILLVTVALVFTYYAMDNPPIGVAVPVGAALFVTARAGDLLLALAGACVVLLTSIWFRWHDGAELGFLVGYEGVTNGALMAAVILLGENIRARRLSSEQADIIQALETERLGIQASMRLENERTAVARDLHDIVGHALSVISIQTAVANEHLPNDARAARSAITLARSTAVQCMTELRGLLRNLRTDEDVTVTGVASLANVAGLLDRVRQAGIDVTRKLDADLAGLPPSIDVTAYRVIQEGLTNVTKHADATRVSVAVAADHHRVDITVEDDGVGPISIPDSAAEAGHGLTGIAERVRLVGGTLAAGAGVDGGYQLHVTLPVREET
jgi:signal transduction histidine kinase